MQTPPKNTQEFNSLVEVVKSLRGPDGCPWDKEQTHQTLTQYAIEEAFELAEAIDKDELPHIVEELGDLLLQVVLHAEIGRQEGTFTLENVIQGITEKMIRRHPHVFGDVVVKDSAQVLENWSKLKDKEKELDLKESPNNNSLNANGGSAKFNPFANIPVNIPALIRAQKIGSKTVRFKFDWSKPQEVVEKIEEELKELKASLIEGDKDHQQEELGDLLFSVVQLARHLDFDAEQALRLTNHKFENRFLKMRELVELEGRDFSKLEVSDLESYWKLAKNELAKKELAAP